MPVCGPKLSLCGLILSVWGIIQLGIMGVLYYVKSVAFIEDLAINHTHTSSEVFYSQVDAAYQQNAHNCWIAACIYIVMLVISGHQFYANSRAVSN